MRHAQVSVPTSLLPGKVMGSWSEEANGDIWAVPGLYHPKMREVHQQVPSLRVLWVTPLLLGSFGGSPTPQGLV